jgi:hypothetical protein
MLRLPNGPLKIAQLPVLNMVRNQFGAVGVEEGPGLTTYQVRFDPYASLDSPASEAEVMIPQKETPPISTIIKAPGLTRKPPERS